MTCQVFVHPIRQRLPLTLTPPGVACRLNAFAKFQYFASSYTIAGRSGILLNSVVLKYSRCFALSAGGVNLLWSEVMCVIIWIALVKIFLRLLIHVLTLHSAFSGILSVLCIQWVALAFIEYEKAKTCGRFGRKNI